MKSGGFVVTESPRTPNDLIIVVSVVTTFSGALD